MSAAAEVAIASAAAPPALLRVLMHTNGDGALGLLPNVTALQGTAIELHASNRSTPVLQMLHDLIFCCETIVEGDSALSTAAALATLARTVVSSTPRSKELGFAFGRVVPFQRTRRRTTTV